jgi:dTDP-4-amino-4,6-dideoxygalactose transaminase
MSAPLALLGGQPAFPDGLPIARPAVPPLDAVIDRYRTSHDRGILTNGPLVGELEARAASRLGVEAVVAVSSCTAGLLLVLRCVGRGPVALPSFTFSATAHAVAWNCRPIRFVECRPDTFQVDTAAALDVTEADTVLATHVFGAPCDAETLERGVAASGAHLLFDAAHGFGAMHRGRPVGGFGTAEVFSLSPTKPLVAGEGGLVATNDRALADELRIGRDYGNPGDYDTRFVGLNARMSELHAALALASLDGLDAHLELRRSMASRYADGLAQVSGIRIQAIPDHDTSTFKDFTIAVDDEFGVDRDLLVRVLQAEGVDTRRYFDPPVHRQQSHAASAPSPLPVTDEVARRVLSLPLHVGMSLADVDRLATVFGTIHDDAARLRAAS